MDEDTEYTGPDSLSIGLVGEVPTANRARRFPVCPTVAPWSLATSPLSPQPSHLASRPVLLHVCSSLGWLLGQRLYPAYTTQLANEPQRCQVASCHGLILE